MSSSAANQSAVFQSESFAKTVRAEPSSGLDALSVFLVGQTEMSGSVRSVPLTQIPFRVGRGSEADLRLDFDSVSRLHAQFDTRDEKLGVVDFGSTNGTFVNGNQVVGFQMLHENDLVQFGRAIFRVHKTSEHAENHTVVEDVADWALTLTQFDKLMSDDAVVPHFQAVNDLQDPQVVVGYEVLARSRLFGLYGADVMFAAASQFKQESELSRMMRAVGVTQGMMLPDRPHLFLNTHPRELEDIDALVASLQEIRQVIADRSITLEIHESAVTDVDALDRLRRTMQDLEIRLAFDDFGCGQSRFLELVEVKPDFLKFDIKLVKDIHCASEQQQRMVANLVRMSRDLGIKSIAEGIELAETAETCRQLGFDLAQGFLFGRPANICDLLSPDEEV